MNVHNSFRLYAVESLRNSDFLDVLMREHITTLKRIKMAADKKMGYQLGKQASPWKPHLKEIIRQVSTWPPREKVLGMPVQRYLESSAIDAIDKHNDWGYLQQVPGSYFTPDFVLNCVRRNDELSSMLPSHVHGHISLRSAGICPCSDQWPCREVREPPVQQGCCQASCQRSR